jgi:predicted nucleic acid-binding protein
MKGKFFIDTNIFIYSFDATNKHKQAISTTLIQDALENGKGIISYQVIQECLNVISQKFKIPISVADAQIYLNQVLNPLCEVFPSIQLYSTALKLKKETQYSFYDSLMLAAALEKNCSTLYSEDLQHGRKIKSVTIINPYA